MSCEQKKSYSNHSNSLNTKTTSVDSSELYMDSLLAENAFEKPDEKEKSFVFFEDYATIETKVDLYEIFDQTYLKDDIAFYAEGTEKYEVTVLTNPYNNHKVKFGWSNDIDSLLFIEASYFQYNDNYDIQSTQSLQSQCGIELGMSLKDLEKWHKKEIRFAGFGWDYAGNVFTDSSSKFLDCRSIVTLGLDLRNQEEEYMHLMGDFELVSSDSTVSSAPIIIEVFTLYLR